jgi:cytosine/uracil/thiamine/allantoin permease
MVANVLSSAAALALGRLGARYHCGYPVLARSVFGMYGHFFFVWIRAVVAIIWFGVQTYFGSQLFSVVLRCIFGSSWWDMANHLPESAGITSRDLLAFFLFWMLELPFQVVHPTKIKFLFAVWDPLQQSCFHYDDRYANIFVGRIHHLPTCVYWSFRVVCRLWWWYTFHYTKD